jgi:uncharacterized protein (TIGR02599 family)
MVVLGIIMMLLFQTLSSSSTIWTRSTGKMQTFQASRAAFESITRNLSQATLQSYQGYADSSGNPIPLINPSYHLPGGVSRNRVPTQYLRQSELHFLSGPAADIFQRAGISDLAASSHGVFFQAPAGYSSNSAYILNQSLLNVCGYYVQFGDNEQVPTFVKNAANAPGTIPRYRLMEVRQSSEANAIYSSTCELDSSGLPKSDYDLRWVTDLDLSTVTNRHVLADNVILLFFLPKLSSGEEKLYGAAGDGSYLSPQYQFDSRSWEPNFNGAAAKLPLTRNRLPPIVEVVMVAIDERSAARLEERFGSGGQGPLANSTVRSQLGLDTGFQNPSALHGDNGDLARLEKGLDALGLNYRIFQTEVRLRPSL